MIIPLALKATIAIGVAVEVAAIAIIQVTTSDSHTVLWIAVVTGVVTFLGTLVTGFVTWSGQQAASRERIAAALEARELGSKVIKTVEEGNTIIEKVDHNVNSTTSDMRTQLKASQDANTASMAALTEMTRKYDLLATASAVAAPALTHGPVTTPITAPTMPSAPLMPPAPPMPPATSVIAATATTVEPIPVVIEGAKEPVPVKIIIEQVPPKEAK